MIYGIVGLPGSGKTYLAVKLALEALKRGVDVYSNLHIFGARYFVSMIQTLKVKRGLIIFDELNVEAGARNIKYLPPQVYRQWSQHRHRGLDIIWTAQTIERIDIIMREITNEVYSLHSIMGKLYWYGSYQPRELQVATGQLGKSMIAAFKGVGVFKPSIFKLYSTAEEIKIPARLAAQMAAQWGWVDKDSVERPDLLPISKEIEQVDISFETMKADEKKGKNFKQKMSEYLVSLKKLKSLLGKKKSNNLPF